MCQTIGQQRFLTLDLHRSGLILEKLVLDQLLCNRAAALDHRLALKIRKSRAHNTLEVDAPIVPECAVFGGDRGIHQHGRDISIIHIGAATIFRIVQCLQ